MRLSTEATLMLLAAALYLFDCFYLLQSHEALLVRGRKRWMAHFGSRNWTLSGREPCLVNVLTPHRSAYKLAWQFEVEGFPAATGALEPHAMLRRLTPFAYIGLVLIFVGLPLALFANLGLGFTLAVVVGIYANNLVALALLFVMRNKVGLASARYWSLAFECLVCPPFCIQLVKRVHALHPAAGDFVATSGALLQPEDMLEVHRQCLARLDDQIAYEDEGTARATALQQARLRFVPGGVYEPH
jgi:hypothetical protein